jgi:DNA-binding CsgD family transcriptional regulator
VAAGGRHGIVRSPGAGRCPLAAGYSIVEAILNLAWRLYRAARETPAETFVDAALGALGEAVHFEAAVWFAGELGGGEFQFHRLHAHRLPLAALKEIIEVNRRFPHPMEATAATPGVPQVFRAPEVYGAPASGAALLYARRWGIEQQLLIAHAEGGQATGEWLALHRSYGEKPFGEQDLVLLRELMPHLSEARLVNRGLSLGRGSAEPHIAPGSHRALALLDGTVLHCGRQVSDSIAAEWPEWNQIRLPSPLLEDLTCNGSVRIDRRGESILARQFSDSLVLTVKSVPLADRLSRREYEVVQLFGAGRKYRQIAQRCGLSPVTVRNIVQRCYRKLGINSKVQLARLVSGEAR